MTTYLSINDTLFEKNGGIVCGDDDFVLVTLSCCGCQCLYNEEILDLYIDPENLTKRYFLSSTEPTPKCLNCGSTDWEFSNYGLNIETVKKSRWAWLLNENC